jgi:hypothetical protein
MEHLSWMKVDLYTHTLNELDKTTTTHGLTENIGPGRKVPSKETRMKKLFA